MSSGDFFSFEASTTYGSRVRVNGAHNSWPSMNMDQSFCKFANLVSQDEHGGQTCVSAHEM